jgi:hypothetical protein
MANRDILFRFRALAVLTAVFLPSAAKAVQFPGRQPGPAAALAERETCRLENAALRMSWQVAEGRLRPGPIVDRLSKRTIPGGGEVFLVVLSDGRTIPASGMKLLRPPQSENLPAGGRAVRAASHHPGKCLSATLVTGDGTLEAEWRAMLRDGDNYVRQELSLQARGRDLPLAEIMLNDLSAEGAKTVGTVRGSPVVAGNLFFACENPLANNQGRAGRVRCALPWRTSLAEGTTFRCASVVGVAPAGQMRRAFLYYVERERARPYQPFLHYNSWYDISWAVRLINEDECLDAMALFCRELVQKRGVRLDSFVLDDGWDDPRTLWGFHAGFPRGFAPLTKAAARCHSAVGVWLSPFGGYAPKKEQRLQYGRPRGFEINRRGFALAGPKYYARFRDVCRQVIEKYGVNYFKFDGIAAGGDYQNLTSEDLADIAALLRLAEELRRMRPDVYLSLTTGTWPSPYWLWYGDSVWRGGNDADFCGEGSMRQQWISYRDATTQQEVVRRGPLFPLNALMNQGIMFARLGIAARAGSDVKDLVDEFRMFFGDGTQLQELYLTPQMMTPALWDALAEAALWSRANADALVDTHWIGGDAGRSEPYGYASWSPRKGILCLRNPCREPRTLTLKLAEAFELPCGAPSQYGLKSPWKADAAVPAERVAAASPYRVELRPFEARVLEATP